jgi:hypothetical protein
MPEAHDFAVVHDIVFPFQLELGACTRFGEASSRHKVLVFHYFSANEPTLYVGMDFPGCLKGGRSCPDCPSPAFVITDGEKRNQTQELIAGVDQA